MEKKRCSDCGLVKALAEFYKDERYAQGVTSICKACKKQRSWRRYLAKREHILAVARAWKHDPANQECQRQYVRDRRARDPEGTREWQRKYAAAHPEIYREATRKWRQRNHGKVLAAVKARRARLKGARTVEGFSTEAWHQMVKTYRGRCAYCGKKTDDLTQDHVMPLIQGGSHCASNIVPACRSCNSRKHGRTPEQAGMELRV